MATEYIKLFTETNIIINGFKNLLDKENIQYIIKDRFESARLGGYGENQASVEVHVLESDIVKAKEILEVYKTQINS